MRENQSQINARLCVNDYERSIVRLWNLAWSQREIAIGFGVSRSLIARKLSSIRARGRS